MKEKFSRLALCICLSTLFAVSNQTGHAQTNAVASGNWSTPATWSAGEPNDILPAAINGGFTVTVDQVGEITNVLDVGSIAGQAGTLNVNAGAQLGLFDTDTVTAPNATVLRLGQIADSTGILNMSGGEVYINEDISDVFDSGDFVVGQSGTGTATISGGTLTAADEIIVGQNAGSSGTLSISNGTLNAARRNMQIGFGGADAVNSLPGAQAVVNFSGTAQVNVADTVFLGFGSADTGAGLAGSSAELNISQNAAVNISGWLQSAFAPGSTSTINQSGGDVSISGLLVHGARGDAQYNHTGGTLAANLVIIGDGVDGALANATYTISGSASLSSNLIMWVGAWGRSHGTVNQNGGTISPGALSVGRDGTGQYNMTAGTLNVNGTDGAMANNHLIVGHVGNVDSNIAAGTGNFTQTGGTITAKTGMFLGNFDNTEGTYKISGGTLNVTGTATHPDANAASGEQFLGDLSIGGALASNAQIARTEPANPNDSQGQALDAKGTFIVSGSGGTISIAGNLLANPGDKSAFRKDSTPGEGRSNSATLAFEIFNSTGVSAINVGGIADLDGAVIDLDLMGSFTPAVNTTYDLIKASSFGSTGTGTTQHVGTGMGYTLATEDAGAFSLAVITSGPLEILRATFLGSVGVPGDFDGDGDVDGRDFLSWQRGNSPNPLSSGDLALWRSNYGTGGLAAVGAVPEPSSIVLLGALGLVTCLARERRA